MGFQKRLFGGGDERVTPRDDGTPKDEPAIERYRYLVRTAPPEAIEQAHEQAFAQLTLQQRRMALQELSNAVPAHERIARDDPKSLARMATRAELQQPGVVERIFAGSRKAGGGYGGLFGDGFMSSLAGAFIGSIIAQGLYDSFADIPASNGGAEGATANGDYGHQDAGQEPADYAQGGEGDLGSDFGGYSGGDLGGTDFW